MSETLAQRRARLMGDAPLFYDPPLEIVRGEGVWLWDAEGRRYLDAYNNVPHVGHCHPQVVEAIRAQAATLSTHTRYLHPLVLDLIERLGATLGHGLTQAALVSSGSEANDIALRIARISTGRRGIVAVAGGYHGNTAAVAQLARRDGAARASPLVRLVPAPDPLRAGDAAQGDLAQRFSRDVALAIADLEDSGIGFAGLILCPAFANEGLPAIGPGFLGPTEALIRRAGGLLIADEVQTGFGRLGSDFWGFAQLGVVPDVVTMGKAMGNGYPVAAVFTRPELMAAFREATGYFSTFGGNPVAAAAALATLEVLEAEELQAQAAAVGAELMQGLQALSFPTLAEVRGSGLFVVAEIATGPERRPASGQAARLVEALRASGVLTQAAGPGRNVVKFRPPMPFAREHAELVIEAVARALARGGEAG